MRVRHAYEMVMAAEEGRSYAARSYPRSRVKRVATRVCKLVNFVVEMSVVLWRSDSRELALFSSRGREATRSLIQGKRTTRSRQSVDDVICHDIIQYRRIMSTEYSLVYRSSRIYDLISHTPLEGQWYVYGAILSTISENNPGRFLTTYVVVMPIVHFKSRARRCSCVSPEY